MVPCRIVFCDATGRQSDVTIASVRSHCSVERVSVAGVPEGGYALEGRKNLQGQQKQRTPLEFFGPSRKERKKKTSALTLMIVDRQ